MNTFSGRNPSQNEAELRGFAALLVERGVSSYLEIGARHGDTFHAIMLSLPEGARGVAVDLPGGLWGQKKSRAALERAVLDLNARGYDCSMIVGDSQEPRTRDRLAALGPFDAILIDGDHTLAGVSRDWQLYGELAPVVALHDIAAGPEQREKVGGRPIEVPILWAELKSKRRALEYIAPGSHMGIGVVCNYT